MYALKQEPEMASFWAWFEKNEARLAETAAKIDDITMYELEQVLDELLLAVQEVDERLYAELGMTDEGSPALLITADGEREVMLIARDLVADAPLFKGWKFSALREREELPDSISLPGGEKLDVSEAVFVMEVHDGKAEIAVGLDEWDDERADDYSLAAEHLVENTLGEADFALGVSGVMALPLRDLANEADPWPMKALVKEFDKHFTM